MPCSTSNNFDIRFTLVVDKVNPLAPFYIEIKDNTNYAALGITQSTVKANVVIHDTAMNLLYRNDNWNIPDITRATTDTKLINLKDRADYTGTWTICYKIQHGTSTITEVCEIKQYTIEFKPYAIVHDFKQDCYNARLSSVDKTNYTQINATRTEESYSHVINSETSGTASVLTGKTAISKHPNLYNEEYTTTITATNLYTFNANFRLRYVAYYQNSYVVDCQLDNCASACCVECLRQRMNENELVNPTLYNKYYDLFIKASNLLIVFESMLRCGNLTAANDIGKKIAEITDCNNGCLGCNCGDSRQISPIQVPCLGTCPECPDCPECPPPTPVYYNTAITESVSKNDCPAGQTPTPISYTVAANTYTSIVSQVAAQALAQAFFDATKQTFANTNGVCAGTACGTNGNAPVAGVCCAGLVNQSGLCVQQCSIGFVDTNGVCVLIPPALCGAVGQAPVSGVCCAGLVTQGAVCQSTCDAGYIAVNGVCQLAATCGTLGNAPINGLCCGGLVNQSGTCVAACSSGFVNTNGTCTACQPTDAGSSLGSLPCCSGLTNLGLIRPNFLTNYNGSICEADHNGDLFLVNLYSSPQTCIDACPSGFIAVNQGGANNVCVADCPALGTEYCNCNNPATFITATTSYIDGSQICFRRYQQLDTNNLGFNPDCYRVPVYWFGNCAYIEVQPACTPL